MKIKIHNLHFEPMISSEELKIAVKDVAEKINERYNDEDCPVVLGILCGSYIFMADLVRNFNFSHELQFTRLSSYDGCSSTGSVEEVLLLPQSLRGRNVLVVEDIVESGTTIAYLERRLHEIGVKSLAFCTLFLKPELYKRDIKIDFVAREIGEKFIVGYGLDYNELGRSLSDIYCLCDE